ARVSAGAVAAASSARRRRAPGALRGVLHDRTRSRARGSGRGGARFRVHTAARGTSAGRDHAHRLCRRDAAAGGRGCGRSAPRALRALPRRHGRSACDGTRDGAALAPVAGAGSDRRRGAPGPHRRAVAHPARAVIAGAAEVAQAATPPPAAATPAPPQEPYERPEWRAAVSEALRTGTLRMPAALAALQLAPDVLRAGSAGEAGRLAPVRTIVETTRPHFRWTPVARATYVVSIFEEETLVAESGVLDESHWEPMTDLPRGRVYQWELEVRSGGDAHTIPAPPAPPALFRVLDEAASAELQRARALHGGDPLLLGVLYARCGLREDAERELRRVPAEQGQRLLQSIARWPH